MSWWSRGWELNPRPTDYESRSTRRRSTQTYVNQQKCSGVRWSASACIRVRWSQAGAKTAVSGHRGRRLVSPPLLTARRIAVRGSEAAGRQQLMRPHQPQDALAADSEAAMRCGIGSSGGRCPSVADYVRGTETPRGATAAGGGWCCLSSGAQTGSWCVVRARCSDESSMLRHLRSPKDLQDHEDRPASLTLTDSPNCYTVL